MKKISRLILCFLIIAAGNDAYSQNKKQSPQSVKDTTKTVSNLPVPVPVKAKDTLVQEVKASPEKDKKDTLPDLSNKKYLSAMKASRNRKEEINKLLGKELEKALPQKLGKWEMSYSAETEENIVNSLKPDSDLFYMVRVFINKEKEIKYDTIKTEVPTPRIEGDTSPVKANSVHNYYLRIVPREQIPKLTVIISNSAEYFDALTRIYDLSPDDPMQKMMYMSDPVKLTVRENRAFYIYNKEAGTGDFLMNAGAAVLRISGVSISGPEILESLANNIDYGILNTVLR